MLIKQSADDIQRLGAVTAAAKNVNYLNNTIINVINSRVDISQTV